MLLTYRFHPCSRLLLRACLATAITIPAAAQTSTPATPSATTPATLPESPCVHDAVKPYPIVNGRPYCHLNAKADFKAYSNTLTSPFTFGSAAVRAGIEQISPTPTGWGQDFPGYMQRFGSAYGESAISSTVRYGLAEILHEDVHYRLCHHCKFSEKLSNAVLAEFTARHGNDGHREFSATPIIASISGPLVAYTAWYPPGYDAARAVKRSFLGVPSRIGVRLLREVFFDRDTKAEKEAAQRTAAGLPPKSTP